MGSRLISEKQSNLPYYEGSNLSLSKFQQFIGANAQEMSQLIGKSRQTVYRTKYANQNKQIFERLKPLLYAINVLIEIADPEEIKRWLHEPLSVWKGRAPMDELIRGNVEGFINLVEQVRAGEGGY